ncbi:hypothetical protein LPJ73_002129, partial [Coemansia sp. RSA 2703]
TIEEKDTALKRVAELETAVEHSSATDKISADRLVKLESSLNEQLELVESLRCSAAQAKSEFDEAMVTNSERIVLLEKENNQLSSRISDMALEAASLSKKLEESVADVASAFAARDNAAAECLRLQSEFVMLAERSRESQLRLEQQFSEARNELNNKVIVIEGLEHALETANASLSASQVSAQDEALTTIKELEEQVAKYKTELSAVQAALGDSTDVEQLAQERDKALESIDTLKTMMIELANSKDGDIAELEASLKRQEELLDASVRETVEKEEALQLAEKLAATHLDRAVKAELELDQATRNNVNEVERLVEERDELDSNLKKARLLEAKLLKEKSQADSELLSLRATIAENQQATLSLEKKVDQLSEELSKAQVDADAGTNLAMTMRKELLTLVEKMATLPGCQSEDISNIVQNDRLASHEDLLKCALRLISAATAAAASSSEVMAHHGLSSDELAQVQQEIDKLRVLNSKLEKKNTKLRDVYKQDITELHAEEEKQRKRADMLSAEISNNDAHIQTLEQQLLEVKGELATQQKQRVDLEATVIQLTTKTNSLQRVRTSEMPTTPQKYASPLVSTPENTNRNGNSGLTASNTKAAMTRLASQRTPMKIENKRVNTTPKPDNMLSPISSSTLNTRLAASAPQEEAIQTTGRYPLRKRTAVNSENNSIASAVPVSANSASADLAVGATKAEAVRTRSTYGDRRRNRRNQPASNNDGLDEQAAEQCAQQ